MKKTRTLLKSLRKSDEPTKLVSLDLALSPSTPGEYLFEPMMKNRFYVELPEYLDIPNSLVRSTVRPVFRRNVSGFTSWDDIVIRFYDPIAPSTQQSLFNLINNDNVFNNQIEFKFQMLDPTGAVVSEWSIYGLIKEINFGELSYDNDDITETSMTVMVDRAILNF